MLFCRFEVMIAGQKNRCVDGLHIWKDDIIKEIRSAARKAKNAGSAAIAITGISAGIAWLVILCRVYL